MKREVMLLIAALFGVVSVISLASASPGWNSSAVGQIVNFTEDQVFTYNFTANVTNPVTNMTFSFFSINGYGSQSYNLSSIFSWISINSSSGVMTINATRDNETGMFNMSTDVSVGASGVHDLFYFNGTPVNDPPIFNGLQNFTVNMTYLFERVINVTDEENNVPFTLNITFLSCSLAQWSKRTDCNLFNSSNYNFNQTSGKLNISFTPLRNDVGSYIINFSVNDLNNLVKPYNASTTRIINFTVNNVNSVPYFTYVCDNERSATEKTPFVCRINVTDVDEINNLTFTSNYSWFTFNNSLSSISVPVNDSTGYNASALISFTPSNLNVGNWSVNINVTDTGNPPRTNSSAFYFYIGNTDDSVALSKISNFTGYPGKAYTININASDNDLLIPDKTIYHENLTFSVQNETGGSINWIDFEKGVNVGNTTLATLSFTPTAAMASNNYLVNVSVTDANNYSIDSKVFKITILNDTPAQWNQSSYTFVSYEGNNIRLNLSNFVSDTENDTINFSFTNDTSFKSFNLTGGIINFTSTNYDVGQHILTLNANDGKVDSFAEFNFTIYNVNDAPAIQRPISADNATVDLNSSVTVLEDNVTHILVYVADGDFLIPQKSFYNESLNLSFSLQGVNASLFNFQQVALNGNIAIYEVDFTPRKGDVGIYNVSLIFNDSSGVNDSISFNLTILSLDHPPVLESIDNQSSAAGNNFYLRLNATDIEDGSSGIGNGNFTFAYSNISGSNIFNSTTFNTATGEFNITLGQGDAGIHRFNVSVNDSGGKIDSKSFWFYVYGIPSVNFPLPNYVFNLSENNLTNLTFGASNPVGDNMTYEFYLNGSLRASFNYYGNNTNLTWGFTPNFTDETYGSFENLTLVVYPSVNITGMDLLNNTVDWNVNITHTTSPVLFSGHIDDTQASFNSKININLFDYFFDPDYFDGHYHQGVNFTISSESTPSYIVPYSTVEGGVLALSSPSETSELISINATDGYTSAVSNSFAVKFTPPAVVATPVSSSGGTRPVSLKIIAPGPLSIINKEKIIVPLVLENTGKTDFYNVNLNASFVKNMSSDTLNFYFDKPTLSSLRVGTSENVSLTIYANLSGNDPYEITINASTQSPSYTDWAKLYLTVRDANKTEVLEKILFTEELIAENPKCIELKEMIDEAKNYSENGDYNDAMKTTQDAMDACQESISQISLPKETPSFSNNLSNYISLTGIFLVFVGFSYYFYRRFKFRRFAIK